MHYGEFESYILSLTLPRFLLMFLAPVNLPGGVLRRRRRLPQNETRVWVLDRIGRRCFFFPSFEVTTVRDCCYLCALAEERFMLLLGPE